MNIHKYIFLQIIKSISFIFIFISSVEAANIKNSATVFMYHKFGVSKYPSTSVTIDQLNSHINELKKDNIALEEKKEAFQKACFFGLKDGLDELLQLPYLARNAGDNGQAANYAAMLLTHARSIKDDTKKAKCIHEAKNVLGLLAYDRGNYEAASDLLLESVSLDRELLRDLHPRLKLAKLLLKQGLTSEVSTFAYKFTDRFGEKVLQRWQLDIRAGKIPSDW